jgi:hypothetical protein
MATSGPMLVAQLTTSQAPAGVEPRECACGRVSKLFYNLWLGVPCRITSDVSMCSFCAGERLQFVPNGAYGKKLMLLPDPRAVLTDDERGDTLQGFSLRDWAFEEGSPALKYRVEHNQEWKKLAEFQWARKTTDERFAALGWQEAPQFIDRPDFRNVKIQPRLTPTEDEVTTLLAARRAFCNLEPMVNATVEVVWVVPAGEEGRVELRVEVPVPIGSIRTLFYTLPQ